MTEHAEPAGTAVLESLLDEIVAALGRGPGPGGDRRCGLPGHRRPRRRRGGRARRPGGPAELDVPPRAGGRAELLAAHREIAAVVVASPRPRALAGELAGVTVRVALLPGPGAAPAELAEPPGPES